MASVVQNKRTSESKFVSICADGSEGSPDVDISFKEPLLTRPSDHYMVGVDNLTVNMNHFPMMRTSTGPDDFVFRIGRLSDGAAANEFDPLVGATPEQQLAAGAGEPIINVYAAPIAAAEVEPFFIEQNYQNFNQLVLALNEYITMLNEKVLSVTMAQAAQLVGFNIIAAVHAAAVLPAIGAITNQAQLDAQAAAVHLSMTIGPDGKLRLIGSRAFWANYFVYIPKAEYQYLLMGNRMSSPYISLDANGFGYSPVHSQSATHLLYEPHHVGFVDFTAGNIGAATTLVHVQYRNTLLTLQFSANLLSSSDRRIALEIGTSLPIINNPMVDHNQVHPDYTVGRWMWNPRAQLESSGTGLDLRHGCLAPAIHEFQNSTDRVQYHSLMPQDKITFLRLKMYCRIRKYNEARDRFEMDTEVMPMEITDWWHCRLHFVSKD